MHQILWKDLRECALVLLQEGTSVAAVTKLLVVDVHVNV